MPAPEKKQKYVKNELPYRLLVGVYEDSRASLREMGKRFNVSYHVAKSVLADLKKRYDIRYTLEIDETELGFTEGVLVTVKFGTKPGASFIREAVRKEFSIQGAYLAEGDFDLLLYVVGADNPAFQRWQWNFRVKLSRYRPTLKFANISTQTLGFFPLRNELIRETTLLSESEKSVLVALNDNSKIRLSELARRLRITPDRAAYVIKKLRKMNIIRRFTALTQNPDKRIFYAYGASLIPIEGHRALSVAMARGILEEDLHEVANDYAVVANANGGYDAFYVCAFKNGEDLSMRGPTC